MKILSYLFYGVTLFFCLFLNKCVLFFKSDLWVVLSKCAVWGIDILDTSVDNALVRWFLTLFLKKRELNVRANYDNDYDDYASAEEIIVITVIISGSSGNILTTLHPHQIAMSRKMVVGAVTVLVLGLMILVWLLLYQEDEA